MRNQSTAPVNSYQSKQLSKTLVILFSAAHLFLGTNLGFFDNRNKKIRAIANLLSLVIPIVTLTVLWHPFHNIYYKTVGIAYWAWNFLVLGSSSYSTYHFLKDMMAIDAKWNFAVNNCHANYKIFMYFLVWFCTKACPIIYITYYFINGNILSNLPYIVAQLVVVMMYFIVSVVNTMVYYHIYLRMNVLRSMLEAKTTRVKDALVIFQSLADCLAKIRVSQDKTVSITKISNCIFTVIHFWGFVPRLEKNEPFTLLSVRLFVCQDHVFSETR